MKYKLALFLTVTFGLVNVSSAQTPNTKEGWYLGVDLSVPTLDIDAPIIDELVPVDSRTDTFEDSTVKIAFNGGYQFSDYLAINMDLVFGQGKVVANYKEDDLTSVGLFLDVNSIYLTPSVHAIYPINENIDVYAKLGLSLILSNIKQEQHRSAYDTAQNINIDDVFISSTKDWDIAPTLGLGAQVSISNNWSVKAEFIMTNFEVEPISSPDYNYQGTDFSSSNFLLGVRYNFH